MTYTRLRITETRLGGTVPIALRRRLKVAEALSIISELLYHSAHSQHHLFLFRLPS